VSAKDSAAAAKDNAAVSGPSTLLAGSAATGLVYPFDFPDPDMILVGHTYFAYATNSVAGNIGIIESSDLIHWTSVGSALPSLPPWAVPHYTWAPAVAYIGGHYRLYYAVDVAGKGKECISVATASQPQGPFVDTSTGPLECQLALGGSIDPSVFVDRDGSVDLLWKSGGAGSSTIWVVPLDPSGTKPASGSPPTKLLQPDQGWEGGTVEAPDLVWAGGRYLLFFSGNNWNRADYAVGFATCDGPLGPCRAAATPVLAKGAGVSGPGGESVFADGSGSWWMAFHAWVPGAVGFPNSRGLYIRRLDLSRAVPVVGAAP
jgi:beta-xylosidase